MQQTEAGGLGERLRSPSSFLWLCAYFGASAAGASAAGAAFFLAECLCVIAFLGAAAFEVSGVGVGGAKLLPALASSRLFAFRSSVAASPASGLAAALW